VILIIDIGNTRVKLAWFDGEQLIRSCHLPSGDSDSIVEAASDSVVEAIGIGSVAMDAEPLVQRLSHIAPTLLISGRTPAPVRNEYITQATLGADRWANAVAAASFFPGRAVLAIDAGTCITYDAVRPDGAYAGGAISPGLALRARAMHDYSSRLPLVDSNEPPNGPLAASTHDSLVSGVWHGTLHECRGFIADFRAAFPEAALVLTGGDGLRLSRGIKSGIFAHPFLTLEGYRIILLHHRAGIGH